jgi:aryl-alcohol dehydrogenase-like predicted oxidoreductase
VTHVLPARAGERGPRRIGLGLASLGRPGYLNLGHGEDLGEDRSVAALQARSFEVLDAAYDAGVRYFDAARSYGRAEEFLGTWLADRAPADVTVGSKWGYVYTADWEVAADPPEVKHHDADTLRRQLAETRERLGDHLDLYQIHSATPDSGVLENDEVLQALRDLRASGVAIGVSVSGTAQPETIDRAVALGMFVIVKEALANGRLGPRAPAAELGRAASALGSTPDAVALAAVLAQPFADVVLSGVVTRDTLASNLAAADLALSDDVLVALAPLEEDSEDYWSTRAALPWN